MYKLKTGYTLPELLITILLMGILFVLALTFSTSTRQSQRIRDYSVAVALAQQAIEIAKAAPFSIIDENDAGEESLEYNFNNIDQPNNIFGSIFVSNNVEYLREVIISDVMAAEDDTRPIGLKKMTVTVTWDPSDGGEQEPFIINTLIPDLN